MNNSEDSFAWANRLGCPPTVCTESAKKALSKGIVGLLWDHVADKLYPTSEVLEAKKNIFLYKLVENSEDVEIEMVKKTSKLKSEGQALQKKILAAEERRKNHEFSLRKKRQQLLNIKSARQFLQAKKHLFLVKQNQMQAQVQDCNQMRQVCECLMPSTGDQIEQNTIEESLTLVSSMSNGGNKKQVWKKISETLHPVATPVLWNILLQSRTVDTERIIQLGSEISQNNTSSNYGEKFEIGIAKACSLHVTAVSKRLLHDARANTRQQNVMEYIEKIEKSQSNGLDISEWLELTLEVRKWEVEQVGLWKEVEEINEKLEVRTKLNAELSNIATAMQGIDVQIGQCAQDIQTCMALLKGAGTALNCVKEKLLDALQKFAVLRATYQDKNWLDVDLSNELENFYDRIDINALRKITLGGEIGAYRHSSYCISQSAFSIPIPLDIDSVHDFPFIQAPIYHLLDCYKILNKCIWFANDKPSSPIADRNLNLITELDEQWCLMSAKSNIHTFGELFDLVDQALENAQEELRRFDATFEAWTKQVVSNVLIFDDRTVDGITFKEWQHRFKMMASLLVSKTKAIK